MSYEFIEGISENMGDLADMTKFPNVFRGLQISLPWTHGDLADLGKARGSMRPRHLLGALGSR